MSILSSLALKVRWILLFFSIKQPTMVYREVINMRKYVQCLYTDLLGYLNYKICERI
jgi:hypothetical protein